jgi:hypothetical protein
MSHDVSHGAGDGDTDVLAMLYSADRIVWYANTGSPNRSALFVLGDERFVDKKLNGIRDTILVDLNHDGESTSAMPFQVCIKSSGGLDRRARVLDCGAGCLDIAISSYVKHLIGYYLNACNGNGDFFPVVVITTNALNSRAVRAADIDVRVHVARSVLSEKHLQRMAVISVFWWACALQADGNMDLVSASINDNKISWYKNAYVW